MVIITVIINLLLFMPTVLIVEDSKSVASIIDSKVRSVLGFDTVVAHTYAQAAELIHGESDNFFIALLDYHLPDAQYGEIVNLAISNDIPSIVFTSDIKDDIRQKIWSKRVVDYVLKEDIHSVEYILYLIKRIYLNSFLKVLVVDDSVSSRKYISNLLKVHRYTVFEAANGREALQLIDLHKDIKMVVTDFNMPEMDGFQLLKELRSKYSREELAVIGISSHRESNNILAARFIKRGANDFIKKPFLSEEFYCRITQNIEMLHQIQTNKDAANMDFLTGLYNRRYFFTEGKKLYQRAKREKSDLAIALLDIDHFKKINDTYGHDIGDLVLKEIAYLLSRKFKGKGIVARFGGEEFCILTEGVKRENIFDLFDKLRTSVQDKIITNGDNAFSITVSIGLCHMFNDSLDEMIKTADLLLYDAKGSGRNKVIACED